jgi:DNA-binding transcriptional regulator YhcF (GntR family)
MSRGLWIPPHILTNNNLSHSEKLVASFIGSFKEGYFGSDRYAAESLGLNLRTVEGIMSNLSRKRIIYRRGGTRFCVEDVRTTACIYNTEDTVINNT